MATMPDLPTQLDGWSDCLRIWYGSDRLAPLLRELERRDE